jgi:hypothetical protein
MLIDDFLPRYDVVEHHQIVVSAGGKDAYAALWRADLAASWLVKLLFGLRMLPSLLAAPTPLSSPIGRVTLRDLMRSGFERLGEDPGREVVLGISGRFWQLSGNISPTDPARFTEPPSPGTARAAFNFLVAERSPRESVVATETRVLCADDAALRSFRCYWRVIGPFSGLIREAMLASIAAAATQPPPSADAALRTVRAR